MLVPGRTEPHHTLQFSFQRILDHLLDGQLLGRIQGFGFLQFPQDAEVAALCLAVSGLQVGTLQPIREQETVKPHGITTEEAHD